LTYSNDAINAGKIMTMDEIAPKNEAPIQGPLTAAESYATFAASIPGRIATAQAALAARPAETQPFVDLSSLPNVGAMLTSLTERIQQATPAPVEQPNAGDNPIKQSEKEN
jgi:hypothetical protein